MKVELEFPDSVSLLDYITNFSLTLSVSAQNQNDNLAGSIYLLYMLLKEYQKGI
jgi:hypothetical protein